MRFLTLLLVLLSLSAQAQRMEYNPATPQQFTYVHPTRPNATSLTVPTLQYVRNPANILQTPGYRFVTDAQIAAWNSGTGGSGTGPVSFSNVLNVPAYLSQSVINGKLDLATYTANRQVDNTAISQAYSAAGSAQQSANQALQNANTALSISQQLATTNAAGTSTLAPVSTQTKNATTWTGVNGTEIPVDRVLTGDHWNQIKRLGAANTSLLANKLDLPTYNANRDLDRSLVLSPAGIRDLFSGSGIILYDKTTGSFYGDAGQVQLIFKNYLSSRDGYAAGKMLVPNGTLTDYVWISPPAGGTVTGGSNSTTATAGGSEVSPDHIFADSTINRPNFALMVDVPLSTTAQIQSFLTTTQTNKRGIIAPGSYSLVGGSQFTQTGNWDNVALLATTPQSVTFIATGGTTCMILTNTHTVKKSGIYGIHFTSTSTGNGYPLLFSNELVSFQGLEIARCKFQGNNSGNWNAFNITQYSTSSNSGGTSSDFYMHDNYFLNIPRLPVEILSQGYDAVRLTNLTIARNRFENTAVNTNEANRMATSLSGLITGVYHGQNLSINAKNIAYEFVNVKYTKAESNTAIATLETCVGYSVSDDGRNSTEQIYTEGGYFNVTSRPFQLLDCKDIHMKGGTYLAGRGIDVNCRNSSFENLNVSCTNLFNAEAIWQFGGTSNGNVLKNSVLSSWGSAALGHEPSYETVVLRGPGQGMNTYNNQVTGNTLKQGKRPGISPATYFTDGNVVNQGSSTPANTQSGNTVQLEP